MIKLKPYITNYKENGYSIINDMFPINLIDKLIGVIQDIQSNAKNFPDKLKKELLFESDLNSVNRGGIPADATDNAVFIIGDPIKFNPLFGELLNNNIFYHIGKNSLDTNNLIYHFMNVTVKHAIWGRSINWHRDFPNKYICTRNSSFFRIMICLDGMNENNGGVYVIPKSHIISDEDLDNRLNSLKVNQTTNTQLLRCGKGDVVLLHPKILHYSPINTSKKPRRNIVIQIGKGSATFITTTRETITGRRLYKGNAFLAKDGKKD